MGIRFLCPSCGKRINVKEQQAGLRGFCPKCGAGVDIPLESTIRSRSETNEQEATTMALAERARANAAAVAAAEARVDPLHEIPTALWYALPPGAAKPYGPVDGAGLSQWIDENRLTPDSMVWREDWPEWRSVASVWPKLSARSAPLRPRGAKEQTAAPPPVIGAKSGGQARASGEPASVATGSGHKAGEVPGPAIGSAVPAGGVYYRRRSNSAYLTTVVILLLVVVALGAVMIWVVMRDPPPSKPKEKTDAATPSSTGAKLPPLENPTYTSPTGFPILPKASASPKPNGSSPASTATGS